MSATRQATILVVDDTPENIDVLRGLLRSNIRYKAAVKWQGSASHHRKRA